jgi:hypothetical protein
MYTFMDAFKDRLQNNANRSRSLDHPIEVLSRKLWPYRESKLILYVIVLAFLDYASTLAAIELCGDGQVCEVGLLAKWALQTGGFAGLFLMDTMAIGTLIGMAIGVKSLYTKLGLKGFGRAAFVFLLIPYFLFVWAVVINNIVVSFL